MLKLKEITKQYNNNYKYYHNYIVKKISKNTILFDVPKSIVICNNNDYVSKFKNIIHLFFKLIIVHENTKEKEKHIKVLYNCVLLNGTFIVSKKLFNFFRDLNNPYKIQDNYIIIHKKNNKIFNLLYKSFNCIICGTQKGFTASALINMKKHSDISTHNDEIHFYDLFWYKGEKYF